MLPSFLTLCSSFALLETLSLATPAPAPIPVAEPRPMITASLVEYSPSRTLKIDRRNILDDIKSDVNSVLTSLGSTIPSYVASGVPNFFQDFPTGDKVQSSLGLDDD